MLWQDHHEYYNSSFISNNKMVGHQYWVDMTNRSDVHVNDMLSQSHRRAAVSESLLFVIIKVDIKSGGRKGSYT